MKNKTLLIVLVTIGVLLFVNSQSKQAFIAQREVNPGANVHVTGELKVQEDLTSFVLDPYQVHYQICTTSDCTTGIVDSGNHILTSSEKADLIDQLDDTIGEGRTALYDLEFLAPTNLGTYYYYAVLNSVQDGRITGVDADSYLTFGLYNSFEVVAGEVPCQNYVDTDTISISHGTLVVTVSVQQIGMEPDCQVTAENDISYQLTCDSGYVENYDGRQSTCNLISDECQDECSSGQTGCNGLPTKWSCGESNDGDTCLDKVAVNCNEGYHCTSGICVQDTEPSSFEITSFTIDKTEVKENEVVTATLTIKNNEASCPLGLEDTSVDNKCNWAVEFGLYPKRLADSWGFQPSSKKTTQFTVTSCSSDVWSFSTGLKLNPGESKEISMVATTSNRNSFTQNAPVLYAFDTEVVPTAIVYKVCGDSSSYSDWQTLEILPLTCINPGTEVSNGKDDNCDGIVDDGVVPLSESDSQCLSFIEECDPEGTCETTDDNCKTNKIIIYIVAFFALMIAMNIYKGTKK